jgi:hypothetical protein
MTKYLLAAAAVAAIGFCGAAFAGEPTKGLGTTTTSPAAMSDAEMDGINAAGNPDTAAGFGVFTAHSAGGNPGAAVNNGTATAREAGGLGQNGEIPGGVPFNGRCTAKGINC